MTFANINYQQPKVIKLTTPINKVDLIVHGQGIIVFDASGACCIDFFDSESTSGIKVQFTESNVLVNMYPSNEPLIDKDNKKGIITQEGAYYWFSIDSQNQRLCAGIGEARRENAIYNFQFMNVNHDEAERKRNKLFLESIVSASVNDLTITSLLRDPITGYLPLFVKNTDSLYMESIAAGKYMPKANLSLVSQKLYDCISGKRFQLNTPDFPNFTKAIEYSIATPGKWCHKCLKQKATEFDKENPNKKETYLRITLGENNGESPGIPYVMEIWPVGHYSPVHNHGNSSAIIRVLHGSINVSLFPFLSSDKVEPFAKADFIKGDITWISPSLNQVHQLHNLETNKDTCITIQCYMYEMTDTIHYDYFDYLNSNNSSKGAFEQNSDADFIEFKNIIKKEWKEHTKSKSYWSDLFDFRKKK